MKDKKIIKRLEKAIKSNSVCKIYMEFREEFCRAVPIQMTEKLIMMIKDGDYQTNGVTIRRMKDIEKIKLEDESAKSIADDERIRTADMPVIELQNWNSVFTSLAEAGEIVIAERELMGRKEGSYAIGRIDKIGGKMVKISYSGPDSTWEGKTWKLPYDEITRVTFASRYTKVLAKYLPNEMAEAEESEEAEEVIEANIEG